MALQVWMPLTDSVNNQGLSNNITTENNGPIISNQGKIGSCYQFDGEDDYISLTGEELYTAIRGGTHPFSVAFWVYHNDDTRAIILGDYMLPGAINFNIELLDSHTVRFYWNATPNKIFANSSVGLQTWAHVAIVYTGTEVDLYVNGALISDKYIGTLQERVKTAGYYYLGRDNRTGATVLNGRLNDFRIYNHALSAKEVHEIAKGLILHYPLNRGGFGLDNLLKENNNAIYHLSNDSSKYPATRSYMEENGVKYEHIVRTNYTSWPTAFSIYGNIPKTCIDSSVAGEMVVTATVWVRCSHDQSNSYLYFCDINLSGTTKVTRSEVIPIKANQWTKMVVTKTLEYSYTDLREGVRAWDLSVYGLSIPSGEIENFYFDFRQDYKVEIGSVSTLWTPNPADSLYSALGLDDNIIADVSGYRHNGTLHNITYSTDTPKYNLCSEFKSANTSYVKCNDSDWMVEKATDITINFWASTDDWTLQTSPRLFSCTEGGGFNTEKGSSGYIRFPCYVYTDNAGTKAYKYTNTFLKLSDLSAGFHMFTFIYNTTGQKLYIDGKLYKDYSFTSYGLHFNKNARLFLGCEANTANPTTPYTDMKMSDFRIYATTLSPESILELYNSPISVANTGSLLTSGEFSEGL